MRTRSFHPFSTAISNPSECNFPSPAGLTAIVGNPGPQRLRVVVLPPVRLGAHMPRRFFHVIDGRAPKAPCLRAKRRRGPRPSWSQARC